MRAWARRWAAEPLVVLAVGVLGVSGCSGASGTRAVAGTHTSTAALDALRPGQSVPVNGLLVSLGFRRTCVRDAAATICAAMIPPGPKSPYAALPSLTPGEAVNGVVVRGKYVGHPRTLTWSFVTSS